MKRCSGCSVEFLSPQPGKSALARIYSANYFLGSSEGVANNEVDRLKRKTAALYAKRILNLRQNRRGKLLEIGCGSGDFLLEAAALGFEVAGIETSAEATATANARLGSSLVQRGEVENINFPEAEFDVIVFSDVIEHVPDPCTFLQSVNHWLRPGGLVFLVTPSTDSWSRMLMGRRWMEYKIEHLFYFNRKSLKRLLTQSGFSGIQFYPNAKILSFEYVRAHFRRFKVPFWTNFMELMGRLTPRFLSQTHVKIVGSGVIAVAYKSA